MTEMTRAMDQRNQTEPGPALLAKSFKCQLLEKSDVCYVRMMNLCFSPIQGMMQFNSLEGKRLGLLHACLQEVGLAPELLLLLAALELGILVGVVFT
jgi:hypothetical protein